jgi:anti-anti-sigma factor
MYELRDEAVAALTPSNPTVQDEEPEVPASRSFTHLKVSLKNHVTLVQFKGAEAFDQKTSLKLQADFKLLADKLSRDSKVLLDFSGVAAFSPASIGILAAFNQTLRNKGSRIALCCLEPDVHRTFFE